jgi:hypothetical protein
MVETSIFIIKVEVLVKIEIGKTDEDMLINTESLNQVMSIIKPQVEAELMEDSLWRRLLALILKNKKRGKR